MRKGVRGGEQPINRKDSLWEQKNKDKENKNRFGELATKHDCQKISLSDSKCFLRCVGRTQRTNGHEWTGGQMSAAQHSSMILAHLEKENPSLDDFPGSRGQKRDQAWGILQSSHRSSVVFFGVSCTPPVPAGWGLR